MGRGQGLRGAAALDGVGAGAAQAAHLPRGAGRSRAVTVPWVTEHGKIIGEVEGNHGKT